MSIRIALVDENQFEALLIADALIKKGIEVTHLWHSYSNPVPAFATLIPDVLIMSISEDAEVARIRFVTEKAVEHTITRILQALKITTNPLNNSRVLLSREYYRWVDVAKHSH